jgi:hypothetical protein
MDITRQHCTLDLGSYFLIASIAMWIFMTLWTQFLDPPKWSDEINAWVTSKRTAEVLDGDGTDGSTCREGSPVSHLSETAQNAFFVTSRNEDGLAIWPVGTNEGPLADDDDDMSSVSDEDGEGKDLEKGKHRGENTKVRTTEPKDASIRKGAASAIETLQTSEPTKEQAASQQPLSTGNSQSPNSRKKQEMRNSALVDDCSNLTEHGPDGPRPTIACPDVTQKKTAVSQLSSCFVTEVELPSRGEYCTLDIPMNLNQGSSPAETKLMMPPSQLHAPTVGTEEFRNEQTSITPSKQSSPEANSVQGSELTRIQDALSILEDLAKTPLPEADKQA